MTGKPFKLRSGNKTSYKEMASSPVDLKSFGVGPGATPTGESPLDLPVADSKEYEKILAGYNKDAGGGGNEKKGQGWKNALTIGVAALTSGLDAVYGRGKILPMSASLQKKKSDEKTETLSERMDKIEESMKTKSA